MLRLLPSVSLAAAVAVVSAHALEAQGLSIRAARRDSITAGATVSAAFMVRNALPDTAHVRTRAELPAEWTALGGADSVAVAPGESEMLILSVVVPTRTLMGTYVIRMWATSAASPERVADSVLVRVPARVATEVSLMDRPGYVVSGRGYQLGFQVRNRGNAPSTVRMSARASAGGAALSDTVVTLAPEESREVRARVNSPAGLNAAVDDVVELSVAGAEGEPARASARVTVIPEPSRQIERFLRLPARVNLRAATSEGVAPFELFGRGLVRDGASAIVDFMFRGPTGTASAFGERDEYRVELRAPSWRARGGDQLFMLSSLTGAGQPGFGAGVDGDLAAFSGGAYHQQFRRAPEGGSELGAFVSYRPAGWAQLAVNHVDRAGGALPGRISSATATAERFGFNGELELARSGSRAGAGLARTARVSGTAGGVLSLDAGHQFADTAFSGSQRGGSHNYVSGNTAPIGLVSFGFNGSHHRTDLSATTGVPYEERFRTAAVSATIADRVTVEAGAIGRGTTIAGVQANGSQQSLRGRADHDFGMATLSLELEGGATRADGARRTFHDVGLSGRRGFRWGNASLYAQRYSGGGLTKGADAARTVGGDATVHAGRSVNATLLGYATRQETPGAGWHSQLDAMVSHTLRTGGIVSFRARLFAGGSRTGGQQSTMYLEYGMPFRMPVSPLRTPGRVTGRVVDAVSGRGVPGALVRLGPQVAITDRSGQVSFGGVPGGQHRLSMSQEASFANAVFVGDPTLVVDSTRVAPTTFSLAIARSARLDIDVRRFAAQSAIGAGADSLRDAGAVSNAVLVLAGETDTLYRTSGEDGKASFTDIPPGEWSLSIRGDTPAFTRFDPDRVALVLAPGEARNVSFRLVPRRREVQMIGGDQELRPTQAETKAAPAPAPTKAAKPNERQHQ